MSITTNHLSDLPDGGNCDFCNALLEPGAYTSYDNYMLVCAWTETRISNVSGPFIACIDCVSKINSVPEYPLPARLVSLHRACMEITAKQLGIPMPDVGIGVME